MSIIRTEFPLQFPEAPMHLDLDTLNGAYGEHGLTYPSLGQAKAALAAMGFMPTHTPSVWKKGTQHAYITRLQDSTTLRERHGAICTYHAIGALITFSGNIPYIKV